MSSSSRGSGQGANWGRILLRVLGLCEVFGAKLAEDKPARPGKEQSS